MNIFRQDVVMICIGLCACTPEIEVLPPLPQAEILFRGTGQSPAHTDRIPAKCVAPSGHVLAFAEKRRNSCTDRGRSAIGNPCPISDCTRDISRQVKAPDWGWFATGPGSGIMGAEAL